MSSEELRAWRLPYKKRRRTMRRIGMDFLNLFMMFLPAEPINRGEMRSFPAKKKTDQYAKFSNSYAKLYILSCCLTANNTII